MFDIYKKIQKKTQIYECTRIDNECEFYSLEKILFKKCKLINQLVL